MSAHTKHKVQQDKASYATGRKQVKEAVKTRYFPKTTFNIFYKTPSSGSANAKCYAQRINGKQKFFVASKTGACMTTYLDDKTKMISCCHMNTKESKQAVLPSSDIITDKSLRTFSQFIFVCLGPKDKALSNGTFIGNYAVSSSHVYPQVQVGGKVKVKYFLTEWKTYEVVLRKKVSVKDAWGNNEDLLLFSKPPGTKSMPMSVPITGSVSRLVWFDIEKETLDICTSTGTFDGKGYNMSSENGTCNCPFIQSINGRPAVVGFHNATDGQRNFPLTITTEIMSVFQ